jgi:2-polyprenyl-3-methyl-5-hydroxy-6-metoxy-1,4-benzoquinol methylase
MSSTNAGGAAICPACYGHARPLQRHTAENAAKHFIPPQRDPQRYRQLEAKLRELWQADSVEMRQCSRCEFTFADPFLAGTPEIYNLITKSDEHYPRDRFEFGMTINALRDRKVRLLEIGAGHGAFLQKAHTAGIIASAHATEYDIGAINRLQWLVNTTVSAEHFKELPMSLGPFDAICMFQVLEHLDDPHGLFTKLAELATTTADLFISVPNSAGVFVQELLTGFWEMPPNHIGRWTIQAIESVALPHGFRIVDSQTDEDSSSLSRAWRMARYRFQARAYNEDSLAGHVSAINDRRVRGPLKRVMAIWDLAFLARHVRTIPPHSRWFHLRREPRRERGRSGPQLIA